MKVKLGQLINVKQSYDKLIEQDYLPVKIRYYLGKDALKVAEEMENFNKLNRELIMKYGKKEKNEQGEEIVRVEPNTENGLFYNTDVNELAQIDVELLTDKLPLYLFLENDKCNLSSIDFVSLRLFIDEDQIERNVENKTENNVNSNKDENKKEG